MKKGYPWLIVAFLGIACIAQFYRISTLTQPRSTQEKLDEELRQEIVDYRNSLTRLKLPPGVTITRSKETQWTLEKNGVYSDNGFDFDNHALLDISNMPSDSTRDETLSSKIGKIVMYLALQIREPYRNKARIRYTYNSPGRNPTGSTISVATIRFPHGVTTIIAYYPYEKSGPGDSRIFDDQVAVIIRRSHWVGTYEGITDYAPGTHFQPDKLP